ncbi:hypothetical protein BD410DRAFT_795109 [Rickenella mellea]|uniref:BTB domain-containing protein n=1 Tax=Rickenella mellea TaxID=50990 RepID=A0A4Y7PQ59_9AGAM|nr:hypothetical protein BD410DRAFT_795109 [Rickenella mellea]
MHSTVLDDMFSLPRSHSDMVDLTFDGLPIVETSDNDEDFTHLMLFFYNQRYYIRDHTRASPHGYEISDGRLAR